MNGDRGDGSTSSASLIFLPTRDLPPLRPLPASEVIRTCLEKLARAIGLGQERVVRLSLEHLEGSGQCQPVNLSTKEEEEQDHSDGSDSPASADTIESRFAQTWLTRIISSSSLSEGTDLQEKAAEVLAALCGNPASEPERTRFHFGPVQVLIQDSAITSDALGNRTWGAAPLLSQFLLYKFSSSSQETRRLPRKVLELGAGTGLVGLALTALAHELGRSVQVDLTDYHPHVLENLRINALLNEEEWKSKATEESVAVSISRLDWQEVHDSLSTPASSPAKQLYSSTAQTLPSLPSSGNSRHSSSIPSLSPSERYDLLIACDCVYDPLHPSWIRSVAHRHLAPGGVLYLISPLRRTHAREVQAVYEAFPRSRQYKGDVGRDATEVGEGEEEEEERLRIVWERDQVGYDNFGPKGGFDGGGGGIDTERRKGLRTTYRLWEIRRAR
ncbi:hypothetical protein BCV69DRAFT_313925 [Microstroma glucosiphilum]|uniref:S-adenosyl-L-methionine-dependent methyltransferase n=1 Tax=Pseudomicrostroma glucosiphilum TaxID=1684307 RepID=A0A316U1A7_9BASI|nr:hypothetical protein BCV69DRAFT_313925 [Pseudomicrostroma glucosiphilum]PWN19169.1 hypothetical protein BCV69DRAFT_313925 [Pseudomicrostroma glucosiphilum]